MYTDIIKNRIAELEKERAEFAEKVNLQIAYYNGAIAELKKLLELDETTNQDDRS